MPNSEQVFEESNMPYFVVGNQIDCGHTEEDYIGSFTTYDSSNILKRRMYDVYVYADYNVCIRIGDDHGDYLGIGHISNLVGMSDSVHRQALKMILLKKFPR